MTLYFSEHEAECENSFEYEVSKPVFKISGRYVVLYTSHCNVSNELYFTVHTLATLDVLTFPQLEHSKDRSRKKK